MVLILNHIVLHTSMQINDYFKSKMHAKFFEYFSEICRLKCSNFREKKIRTLPGNQSISVLNDLAACRFTGKKGGHLKHKIELLTYSHT